MKTLKRKSGKVGESHKGKEISAKKKVADKPRMYRKGHFQRAECCSIIRDEDGKILPRAVYIHCEELSAKDCDKLLEWLKKAKKWMSA